MSPEQQEVNVDAEGDLAPHACEAHARKYWRSSLAVVLC
jgi:hypothetical protein